MKKFVKNFGSSSVDWPPDDGLKTTLKVPRIIVTTASLDHLNSAEITTSYLRPLEANVENEIPKFTTEDPTLPVGDDAENEIQSLENMKNFQYEWVGEPLEEPTASDGGWSWMVLFGVLFMACSLLSLGPCFGVLFNDAMRDMGVSSTHVAWIFNVNMFSWNLSSILSGPLIKHFGWRVVGCTSSFLLAVVFILIAFSWSPLYIFFMFGVLIGSLGGIAIMTCILILPAYFNKRRGMANSLFSAGIPIGYIIFPVLIRYLQDEFGFFGATIIHGALLLNCCVASALFRPLKKSKAPHPKSSETLIAESRGLEPLLTNNSKNDPTSNPETPEPLTWRGVFSDVLKTTFNNLKCMKHTPLLLTTVSIAVFLTGTMNYLSMLPFALRQHGYSAKEASYALSMTGVGNIVIRIAVSFVADAKWFNRKYAYILGLIIMSSCSFLTPAMMSHYSYLLVIFVLWGVGLALSSAMFLVILIDVVGLSFYESSTSILGFLLAFISISAGPIFGYIRDVTSSYTWSLMAVATLKFVSAILWVFMPCVQRMHSRRSFLKHYRTTNQKSGRSVRARRDAYRIRQNSGITRQGEVPFRRSLHPFTPTPRPPMRDASPLCKNSSIPRDTQTSERNVSPAEQTIHIFVPERTQPNSERIRSAK
ncbi:Major facilitator superfamily [Trinorchestia longiramus]|nr:Major facilitator superfamily [Trinorchestia longiramus]